MSKIYFLNKSERNRLEKIDIEEDKEKNKDMIIDVACTAVKRPLIIEKTFKSFRENLFKDHKCRLVINIDPVGDNINPNIKIKSQVCTLDLIGDKGYIINKTFNYKENTVNVITPLKKNSRNKFIHKNNKKLSYRYIIENTICSYKKDNRINTRKDRKIKTFMGWVYISCLNHNLNINKRMIANQ